MKLATVSVGMRSDGQVVLVLTAEEKDEQGNAFEVAFAMTPALGTMTADNLKVACERAAAWVPPIA